MLCGLFFSGCVYEAGRAREVSPFLQGELREESGAGTSRLKFHQALTESALCSLEAHAFVPFNQYVIKLKSQLKNFQWC